MGIYEVIKTCFRDRKTLKIWLTTIFSFDRRKVSNLKINNKGKLLILFPQEISIILF